MYNFFNVKLIVRYLNVLFLRIFLLTFLAITFLVGITIFYQIINILYSKDVSLFFYLKATYNITILFVRYYLIITIICSILFTFAYLNIKSELYIIKSCGISFYNIMFYFLPSLVFIFFFTFYTNNYLVPHAQKNIILLTRDLLYYNPISFIKEKEFTNLFNKVYVYIDSRENDEMRKIEIYKLNEKNTIIRLKAEKAIVNRLADKQGVQIILKEGYLYIDFLHNNGIIYESIRNEIKQDFIINLNFNEILKDIFNINDISCLDSLELIKKIHTLKKKRDKNINDYIMQYSHSDDTYTHNDDVNLAFLQYNNENINNPPINIHDIKLINKKYYIQIFSDIMVSKEIQSYNEKENKKFYDDIHKETTELYKRNSIVLICCILFLLGIARGWLLSHKNYIVSMILAICFAGIYYIMLILFPQNKLINIILPVYIYIFLLLFYCIFASKDIWLYKKVRI